MVAVLKYRIIPKPYDVISSGYGLEMNFFTVINS